MELVRLCTVGCTDNWLGSSINHLQGRSIVFPTLLGLVTIGIWQISWERLRNLTNNDNKMWSMTMTTMVTLYNYWERKHVCRVLAQPPLCFLHSDFVLYLTEPQFQTCAWPTAWRRSVASPRPTWSATSSTGESCRRRRRPRRARSLPWPRRPCPSPRLGWRPPTTWGSPCPSGTRTTETPSRAQVSVSATLARAGSIPTPKNHESTPLSNFPAKESILSHTFLYVMILMYQFFSKVSRLTIINFEE